jgi:hypothetical protein
MEQLITGGFCRSDVWASLCCVLLLLLLAGDCWHQRVDTHVLRLGKQRDQILVLLQQEHTADTSAGLVHWPGALC